MYDINTSTYLNEVFFQHQFLMIFTRIGKILLRSAEWIFVCVLRLKKMNMEEMYEVLKFIEHGTQCRQSMDSESGELLIYCLRDRRQLEKKVLFEWFRQIGVSLDQFHRCRRGQRYRYLNPYSIVVAENGRVYLLDQEAPENERVMKQMQNRVVRKHFVKPVCGNGSDFEGDVDLFGYGRTMQFVLAYVTVTPGLSRREEKKMSRIIRRCTEVSGNRYSDVRQAAGDIPAAGENPAFMGRSGRKAAAAAAGCLSILAALSLLLAGTDNGSGGKTVGEDVNKEASTDTDNGQTGKNLHEEYGAEITDEEYIAGAGQVLQSYLLENTAGGNEQVLLLGRELERNAVRSLAAAYERQEMTEEAVQAYDRLLEIEEGIDRIEAAAEKKMRLEAGQGQYAQAVLTGEEALLKVRESKKIRQLTEECRLLQNGQEQGGEEAAYGQD